MAESSSDAISQNRSTLKDFLTTLATVTGDLTNITAPPFVLDVKSTVEIPAYWAENPSVFCAPATSEDPAERALLALKTFLSGLRSQCYLGHSEEEGLKKPLNAFLGELFLAEWEDQNGRTHVVSEQVSHHPPITASRIWNDKYGVSAESYNQPSITFTGSVHIDSAGLVLKSIHKYDEHYLVPIPSFKVTGLLSTPYPELTGTYYIPSTSGYMSVIRFQEKGMFSSSSKKHSFEAHVFKEDEGESKPIYTVKGSWFDAFTLYDNKDREIGTVDVKSDVIDAAPAIKVVPLEQQDPWETRNAWQEVQSLLKKGDMKGVSEAKNKVEEGQRQMRKQEEEENREWQPLFFEEIARNPTVEKLTAMIPTSDARKSITNSGSGWTMDMEKWQSTKKPYHGKLRPDNSSTKADQVSSTAPASTAAGQQDPASVQSERRSEGQPLRQFDDGIDHKVGAVDDGRPAEADGLQIDIGRSPEKKHIEGITKDEPGPQAAQVSSKEAYEGSGIEGMSLKEKQDVEDMLRDQYSTGNDERDYVRKKKHQKQ